MKIDSLEKIEYVPLNEWDENIIKNEKYKQEYSEVCTPFKIAIELVDFLPMEILSTPLKKFLDAGCGCGNLSIVLYKKLYESILSENKRETILNVIHLIDINKYRLDELHDLLPCKNIFNIDLLKTSHLEMYDVIICNPPFIIDKVTVWPDFMKKCMNMINNAGYLLIIIPSIWMKPQHEMFEYITTYQIHKLKCLKNNEANKLFNGDARTPMCYMLIQKIPKSHSTLVYDNMLKKYIEYDIENMPIPMYIPYLIKRIIPYVKRIGSLKDEIQKTNCPSKSVIINNSYSDVCMYPNIKTCKISKELIINYSNKPLAYYDKQKIVLANKMYGIPFYDKNGKYGISTRDNYVYVNNDPIKCNRIYEYLNCELIYMIYESTRYRMGYLEKYAFEFIPNILNMNIDLIVDDNIYKVFNIESREISKIKEYISRTKIKSREIFTCI